MIYLYCSSRKLGDLQDAIKKIKNGQTLDPTLPTMQRENVCC